MTDYGLSAAQEEEKNAGSTLTDWRHAYENETVLVTGGAGFIGSNLVRRLLDFGVNEIVVIDDLSSSFRWNLPNHEKVKFVQGSILDDEKLVAAFELRPKVVFHLAAHFANQNSVEHPEYDLLVNGSGTLKLLRLSQSNQVDRFVFASSGCSVYGSEAPLPLREEFVSIHLDTPYQITKLLGELYCNYFHDYYGLKVSIPRFFNVYGPGEIPGRYRNVIPNFVFWGLNGKPLQITGTGEETRDFTFVSDVVNGILRCGCSNEAIGEPINLASGQETRIKDLAPMVNRLTGNKAGITFVQKRDWDKSSRRRASIDKAHKMLGYRPLTEIERGVGITVKWFRENWDKIRRDAKF